jgi:hypothetical protein
VGSGKVLLCIMDFFVSSNNKLRETISIYDGRTMARLSADDRDRGGNLQSIWVSLEGT